MTDGEGQTRFGLKESTIAAINAVFAKYPGIERAVLYGSRAKGTHRPGSDIDLTLIGEAMTYQELQRMENEIDDLLLPYMVDLSLHLQIDNPDLLAHIERVGVVFYNKEDKP